MRLIFKIGIFLIFLISVLNILKIFGVTEYFDFKYYYLAVLDFSNGINPYLVDYFPFPYPPVALLFFYPFVEISLFIAGKIYFVLSFVSLILTIILLLRAFNVPLRSLLSLFIFILFFNFFPTKFSLVMGQLNIFILLLLTLFIYWYKTNRKYLSGLALSLAISLKIFPFLIVPYLAVKKEWKILKALIIALLTIASIVYLLVPYSVIEAFFTNTIPTLLQTGGGMGYYDQSLSAFLARLIGPESVHLARIIGAITIIFTLLVIWMKRSYKELDLLMIGVFIILNVLLNGFAWQHHFVWLLIPFFILFFYIKSNKFSKWYYFVLGLSYCLLAFNFESPNSLPTFFLSNQFYGGIILYFLSMYIILKKTKN